MAKQKFNTEIAKEILKSVAVATTATGLVALLVVMPGMGRVIKELGDWYWKADRKTKYKIRKTFEGLRRARLIKSEKLPDGSTKLVLTEKGRQKVLKYDFDNLNIKPMEKWDKKWHFVIFDLPKRYRNERELFRYKLKTMGFCKVNKSVWVHALPCRDEIDFVAEYLGISPYVRLIEADSFDGSEEFKKFFDFV